MRMRVQQLKVLLPMYQELESRGTPENGGRGAEIAGRQVGCRVALTLSMGTARPL